MAAAGFTMASLHIAPAGTAAPARLRSLRVAVPIRASSSSMKTRIERVIEKEGTVILPGCYDALSAAIVEKSGFSAGFVSGYAVSASLLGKPDIGFLTPPEMADRARSICAAAPLTPFVVDADTGGGNALNVQRTVRDLIAAGAAGCFIEDQAWPKKCGHMRGKQVIPAEEHAAKIASARDAVGSADFFLIARTDARSTCATTGLSNAIDRANLYLEAGANAVFVEAPRGDDELKEISRRVKGYKVCNMIEGGVTPMRTRQELNAMGFHLIIHSTTAIYAAARGLIDVLGALKESGSSRDHLDRLTSFEEFNALLGLESWFEIESRFSKFTTKTNGHAPAAAASNADEKKKKLEEAGVLN